MKTGSYIYFDEPFLTIHWEEDDKIVWMAWREPIDSASFRRGVEKGLELLALEKGQKWLADCLRMGPVQVEDTKWVSEDWMARAVPLGLRWMTFVMARRVVTSMGIKVLLSSIEGKELVTGYFDNPDEARSWLRAQR